MPNPRKKIKSEFWIVAGVAAIIAWSLLASWWAQHAVIGWIILIAMLGGAGYVLYKYASVRGWLGHQVKQTVHNVVFEKVASDREPLSPHERNEVLKRSQSRCENENCTYQGKPHIHHIDMNNQHNNLGNLIALCPNCHQKAHDGTFSHSQLVNWVRRDHKQLEARSAQDSGRRVPISNANISGYCIRCKTEIALDPRKPYCNKCYASWEKYANDKYEEQFCHICGKSNKSTLQKPSCYNCYKIEKNGLKFPSQ